MVCVTFPEGGAREIERGHAGAGRAAAHHKRMAQITGCAGDEHNARIETVWSIHQSIIGAGECRKGES